MYWLSRVECEKGVTTTESGIWWGGDGNGYVLKLDYVDGYITKNFLNSLTHIHFMKEEILMTSTWKMSNIIIC